MTKYIHYGCSRFIPEKFEPVKNQLILTKPSGGLWASRVGAKFGWKEWCEEENFRVDLVRGESFVFSIKESANVINISSQNDLESLPQTTGHPLADRWCFLDFEEIASGGVDAIEVNISDDLRISLYGWDCDSILVLNKDIIIQDQR